MRNWKQWMGTLALASVLGLAGCGHQGSDEAESPAAAQQRAEGAQQAAAAQAAARQAPPQPGAATQPK